MARFKKVFFRAFTVLFAVGLLGLAVSLVINGYIKDQTEDAIIYSKTDRSTSISEDDAKALREFDAECILVLGAGIIDAKTPTPMLKDRLDLGIELYKAGAAPKILLSGDNGQVGHNELHVMLSYVREAGVPEEDIFCDHAGFSTYDSLYRAQSIFGVERALVVTQRYHEYRALYIGEALGLEVRGASADQERYSGSFCAISASTWRATRTFSKLRSRLPRWWAAKAFRSVAAALPATANKPRAFISVT